MTVIKAPVISSEAKVVREETLPQEIFSRPSSYRLLAQAIRVFLSNQRKANAKTKTRSEVAYTGAKIWRQKGTGRARHGDRKAPIFVGGGVAHGPTGEQNYTLKLNQKARQRSIFSVLTQKAKDKKIFLLENPSFSKTKQAQNFLKQLKDTLKIDGKMCFLLSKKDQKIQKALRNLKDLEILKTGSLNAYHLLKQDNLFLTLDALEELKTIFLSQNETH